ncbi:hypothetical protein BO70DRAFT_359725 [Aspergillus heteromorphus CBS 117.55]|uniref:Uncharacterized protein n=1 Tax=Aspergillus heteromorphus CBS 117.55 TaxID=1448321 RepID=A0A317WP97_9EURO|nr:uncharacterized protein BO70DRAFT_359725 [Aspergillus heteromorphus CBS 117.55]PWY88276.1 hypothetical protein BO70DRAFT_359725 [Aspergillus heteromorphus CBS 117.55]
MPLIYQLLLGLVLTLLIPLWPSNTLPFLHLLRSLTTTPMMDGISLAQKAQLHEVADLMLEIYKTLAAMRYIDAQAINPGPHNVSDLLYGLDPAVIYLYSILPYIDKDFATNTAFFNGGIFADFRKSDDVEQGRDPFYGSPSEENFEDEDGPYMRPWVTPLSLLGNHGSAIVYDTRQHHIWIIDQEGWSSTDPALEGVEDGEPDSINRNYFAHIANRPAGDVLRDMVRWYRELKELPGGTEYSDLCWDHWDMDLKSLFEKNGWPDNFDGDAFLVDQAREFCALRAKGDAENPLGEVKKFTDWKNGKADRAKKAQEALDAAQNLNETWKARFELWNAERSVLRNTEELKKAQQEADRLCPNGVCQRPEDLPLWELVAVQRELGWKQNDLSYHRDWAEKSKESDPEEAKTYRAAFYLAEKEVATYEKAYEAAKADADRLCPGRSPKSVAGIKDLDQDDTMRDVQRRTELDVILTRELDALREWAAQIPPEANEAKGMADNQIEGLDKSVEDNQAALKKAQDWIAEEKEKE